MIYQVSHITTYQYSEPVSLCHSLLHLKPRDGARQTCHSEYLAVEPEPGPIRHHLDYFGNSVTGFTIQKPHRRLQITAKHLVEVSPIEVANVQGCVAWEQVRDQIRADRSPAMLEAFQFTFNSPFIRPGADLVAYAEPSFSPGRPLLAAVIELTSRIAREFTYDQRATHLATPLREVLRERRGVCQDFAHLEIGCLRSLGLPARYVSGYLQTAPPAGQPRLVGADASHAWIAVFCPGIGWVDFDPTNNLMPSDKHITLAWGRDYDDVSPIKGVILGGGSHTMQVAVDVTESE